MMIYTVKTYQTQFGTIEIDSIDNEYYELYDNTGFCINEGEPFFHILTLEEVESYLFEIGYE